MKRLLSLLLAAVFTVCSFTAVLAKTDTPTRTGGFGMNVSAFSTTDLDGNPVDGSMIADADLTFINYWATWCGPCRMEMPHIQALHEFAQANEDYSVQFLGVISEGNGCTPASALQFLKQNGYTWTNVRRDSVFQSVFSTCGYIPQTIIVDKNGVVRDHIVGSFTDYDSLKGHIDMWLDIIQNREGETCTVSFKDENSGITLIELEVVVGEVFSIPAPPQINGYAAGQWKIDPETDDYSLDPNLIATFYDPFCYYAAGDATIYAEYRMLNPGDLSYDGSVDVSDAVLTLNAAVGTLELDEMAAHIVDFDNDGAVTVSDAILVLKMAMGI